MNTLKPNTFFQPTSLSGLISDVFQRSIQNLDGAEFANTTPAVNISESNDKFLIELAAPGLQKSNFKLVVDKDQLIISATKEEVSGQIEEGKWTRKEFNFNTFKRSFHISDKIEIENIHAEYVDGMLKVSLPKKDETKANPLKVIEIK